MAKDEFIYGYQSLRGILRYQPGVIQRLFLQQQRGDDRIKEILQWAQTAKVGVTWVGRAELEQMVGSSQHQGMAAQCTRISAMPESMLEGLLEDESQPLILLILDGVQDPHNLGACLRTANAMGVAAVITPKDRAVGLTEVVHKTACGATAVTPFIQVTNLARTLREIKEYGVWLVGLDAEADTSIMGLEAGKRVGLILGSEGEGLRRLTKEHCDYLVHIPMYGTVDSLNVSVAAAIGLYELQRKNK